MSKFAIGEQVENVADDHESGTVVAVFPTVDGLANASNRTPRLVATTAENITVEPSGKAPLPATKRSRASPTPKRTKATKAKGKQEAPSAPLTVSAAPTVPEAVPEAVPASPERASGAIALV